MNSIFKLAVICCLLSVVCGLRAQQTQVYKPNINRVLFVIDVSGSMKEKWGERTKYETAKELLYKLIDSVEKKNPNVEFAVRAAGAVCQEQCSENKNRIRKNFSSRNDAHCIFVGASCK